MNHKLAVFSLLIFAFLSNVVLADTAIALIFFAMMLPFLAIIGIAYSLGENFFIAYIAIKFICKKQIKDKSRFFTFILKHTFVVGIIEIALFLLTTTRSSISTVAFSILSGIAIFFVFKEFLPKDLKIDKKQTNICSLIMSILTNPGVFYLAFYILLSIIKIP